jgi:opacity protein-like surface antigen
METLPLAVLAALLLAQLAAAENDTNQSGMNLTGVGAKIADQATDTGNETLNSITKFLADAGPFILIGVGILIFLLSGIAKWIAVILIILGVIKLLWTLFAG